MIIQFSHSIISDSLGPHGLQHTRLPYPSPTPRDYLPKGMSIESMMPSNHLTFCRPLLLPPSIFPSIFSNESVLPIRWPKYWSFNFSISPSNEHPGLISFRMDWLDLLSVQGTLKSPTSQFKRINSSALSFLHSPTLTSIQGKPGKTIALTRQTFFHLNMEFFSWRHGMVRIQGTNHQFSGVGDL